jgi:hypothetical protein
MVLATSANNLRIGYSTLGFDLKIMEHRIDLDHVLYSAKQKALMNQDLTVTPPKLASANLVESLVINPFKPTWLNGKSSFYNHQSKCMGR